MRFLRGCTARRHGSRAAPNERHPVNQIVTRGQPAAKATVPRTLWAINMPARIPARRDGMARGVKVRQQPLVLGHLVAHTNADGAFGPAIILLP